jgi:hypothetical protein
MHEIAKKMVYVALLVDIDFIEKYSAALYIPGRPELFPSSDRVKQGNGLLNSAIKSDSSAPFCGAAGRCAEKRINLLRYTSRSGSR